MQPIANFVLSQVKQNVLKDYNQNDNPPTYLNRDQDEGKTDGKHDKQLG